MGWMTQRMSGLTKDGIVKGGMFESAGGLLDNKPKEKNLKGFIQSLTEYNRKPAHAWDRICLSEISVRSWRVTSAAQTLRVLGNGGEGFSRAT
jgi:hypothetical protein